MRKTMEQIVLEGQVAKCRSIEELYVLWELMQQMEEDPFGNTCYPELDQRNFHVDGIADPEHYDGTLYILKETNMRKMIQKGETMPVVSDIRADFLSGKSPSGRVEYLDYLTSMQKILWEEKHPGEECRLPGKKLREKAAVLYINKTRWKRRGRRSQHGLRPVLYRVYQEADPSLKSKDRGLLRRGSFPPDRYGSFSE